MILKFKASYSKIKMIKQIKLKILGKNQTKQFKLKKYNNRNRYIKKILVIKNN